MAIGEQTPLLLRSKRRDHHDLVFEDMATDDGSQRNHICTFGTNVDSGVWLSDSDSSETVLVLFIWVAMLGSVAYTLQHSSHVVTSTLLSTVSALALACHAKTALTDPGSVPSNAIVTGKVSYCVICQAAKPPLSHHCRTCRRCVARMDHHCPWVRNCVGACNMKHFLLFLVYTLISCVLMLYESLSFPSPLAIGLAWVLVIPSCSFVSYVLWSMLDNVKSGIGSIDRLQGNKAAKRLHFVHDVMGTNFAVGWLPIDPIFQDPAKVLKYTVRSAGDTSVYSTRSNRHHLNDAMMDVLDV